MGKIYEVKIDRFDGGISEDKRSKDYTRYSITKGFDAFNYAYKLKPLSGTTARETKTADIVKFEYALGPSSTYYIFGFGTTTDGTKTEVWRYNSGSNTWEEFSNNTSGVGGRNENVFFHYKNWLYMLISGTTIIRCNTTAASAFNDSYQTMAYTTAVQPVLHPVDDIAYFFGNNTIYSLDDPDGTGAGWNTEISIPSNMDIVSACAYGNYLAIAAVTNGDYGKKSFVYLWDRDSISWNDVIDFGSGEIMRLACLDNKLIAIVDSYPNMVIREANGLTCKELNFIKSNLGANLSINCSQVVNNRLYFSIDLDGDNARNGIWAVDSNGKLALELQVSDADSYEGFYFDNYYWWIAHSNDGSVDRTESSSGAPTSVYESLIFGDTNINKKLLSVGVMTEPLTFNGNYIKLEYRTRETGTYVEIFTKGTRYYTYLDAVTHETASTGISIYDNLPEFREIQFRITSTNGDAITGLVFKYEELDTNLG